MLSDTIRILNFDGSLLRQPALLERFHPVVVDCTALGPSCRLWINKKDAGRVSALLTPELRHSITFTGSGDFHHITALLLEQFDEPISVVVFDFHPDWDILPPRCGCGSWVSAALRRRAVRKMVLIGAGSDDLDSRALLRGNLSALAADRVELYPYAHRPSTVLCRRVPENISLHPRRRGLLTDIHWRELRHVGVDPFMEYLIGRIPTRKIYISIDKDCLAPEHALTNWEPGRFGLDELLRMLDLLQNNFDIIGLDITGEYSPPVFAHRLKTWCSRVDHPRTYSAHAHPEALICRTNEQTNLRLAAQLLACRGQ